MFVNLLTVCLVMLNNYVTEDSTLEKKVYFLRMMTAIINIECVKGEGKERINKQNICIKLPSLKSAQDHEALIATDGCWNLIESYSYI